MYQAKMIWWLRTGNCGSVQLELAVGIDGRYVHKRDLATYE